MPACANAGASVTPWPVRATEAEAAPTRPPKAPCSGHPHPPRAGPTHPLRARAPGPRCSARTRARRVRWPRAARARRRAAPRAGCGGQSLAPAGGGRWHGGLVRPCRLSRTAHGCARHWVPLGGLHNPPPSWQHAPSTHLSPDEADAYLVARVLHFPRAHVPVPHVLVLLELRGGAQGEGRAGGAECAACRSARGRERQRQCCLRGRACHFAAAAHACMHAR